MATILATRPFPRLDGVKGLEWDKCFKFTKAEIQSQFIGAIATKATNAADNPTRRLAALLLAMTYEKPSEVKSTAVVEGYKPPAAIQEIQEYSSLKSTDYAKIVELQDTVEKTKIGRVGWSPKGTRLTLWCHSLFDLLGACMSDAAYVSSSTVPPLQVPRTKGNYFAPLVSLYSYWCLRLITGGSERRPAMVGIACLGDVVLLGCSIPYVPPFPKPAEQVATVVQVKNQAKVKGVVADTTPVKDPMPDPKPGKELIRLSRFADLQGRGGQRGSEKQILDLNKAMEGGQNYGNCAETYLFALLSLQHETNLKSVFGVAVHVPTANVDMYVESNERIQIFQDASGKDVKRMTPLCPNCSRLITQIDIWGPTKTSTVVKNFNVMQWTLK